MKTNATTDEPDWDPEWTLGVRVWLEREGRAILGKGRLELLEGIERWQSISAAARQMGMSYRHAWLLVQSANNAAGKELVTAATGGRHGGGARLTAAGQVAVRIFRQLTEHLDQAIASTAARVIQRSDSASLHVFAAVSLEPVLGPLLVDFALMHPDLRVRAVYGASDELANQIVAGGPADVFLSADEQQLEVLNKARLIARATSTLLAENSLAAIGPARESVRIRRAEDLRLASVKRLALAGASCPLGSYSQSYLEAKQLYAALLPRCLFLDSSRAVVDAVAGGQAEVGLVYSSDAARALRCRILFQVKKHPVPIRYAGAVITRARLPQQAHMFLQFLSSKAAARRFLASGFTPAPH